MRAITVRQPWAWAIVHGGKDVENRSRNIAGSYRGPVAIHAGLALADLIDTENRLVAQAVGRLARAGQREGLRVVPARVGDPDDGRHRITERFGHRGAFVGIVELVDVHHATQCRAVGPLDPDDDRHCSRWAMHGHHHLVLADARPLREPVPTRGRLGLWTPDAGTIDAIIQAVAS